MANVNLSEKPTLWLPWLRCNALGLGGAAIVSILLTVNYVGVGSLSSALIVGTTTGILQARVLKQRLPKLRYWQWILANILGGYGGLFLGIVAIVVTLDLQGSVLSRFLLGLLYGAAIGISIGFTEMIALLLHTRLTSALVWWLMTLLGRSLGWAAVSATYYLTYGEPVPTLSAISTLVYVLGIVGCALLGSTIYSLVSGWALMRLAPRIPRDRPTTH